MKFNIGQEVVAIDIRNFNFKEKGIVEHIYNNGAINVRFDSNNLGSYMSHQLAPANTLEGLVPGDVVLDEDGEERTVIERLPQSVLLSRSQILEGVFGWFTITELKNDGYSVKSANKEEPQTFPQIGDTFYRINSQGKIIAACWVDDQRQHNIKEYGNVFKTEAEAEEALEKIKGCLSNNL